MGYTIFTTEKPSVAQEYVKVLQIKKEGKTNGYVQGYSPVLGKEVQVTWAVGHLISLASVPEQLAGKALSATAKKEYHWNLNNLPIFPDKYLYLVNYTTKDQYNVIKSLYTSKDVDAIYYAGDSGREGIYIQALIRNQIFGGKTPNFDEKVVWIDSQTEEEILRGIREAKPYSSYKNKIDSGYARAIDDFLIGMNGSEGLTVASKNLIVTGRVMTPTLNMVVERQKEIDNFVPTDYYGINANPNGYNFVPKWKAVKGSAMYESDLLYNETGFLKEKDAKEFLENNLKFNGSPIDLEVDDVKVTEKKETAPLLFSLGELQKFCSKKYHISPDETLNIAQSLYEKKMTTYPRTDARVLSSAVAKDLEQKLGKKVPAKYIDDSAITDHYAIIPTFQNHLNQCNDLEKQIFNDIMLRFKAIFMPAYVYDSIAITLKSGSKEKFFTTEKTEKQLGWKELYQEDKTLVISKIPDKGDVLPSIMSINPMQTKPPVAYTTGTLIEAMEKAGKFIDDDELKAVIKGTGIGTSATRAGIIKKLADKNYITINGKTQKVAPTETGKAIIPVIAKVDERLVSPEKTADLEQRLADIDNGTIGRDEHTEYMREYINELVDKIKGLKDVSVPKIPNSTTSKGKKSKPTMKKSDMVYIKVPFDEKDEAKGLGARWDSTKKSWYCNKKDIDKFSKWINDNSDYERKKY